MLGCVACDRDGAPPFERAPPEPTPVAAAPSSIAERLGVDASDLTVPVDPPAPAGDLRAELDGFTTLDACVAQHSVVDPLVGDAIRALGYDTFLRDACRVLEAAKRGDRKECDAIDASGLRRRCASVVAMVAGDPDACPWSAGVDPALGRDPTCVAAAARDPRLCAGEQRGDRAACEALAARDESRCARAGGDAARTCRREALRFKRALEGATASGGAIAAPRATLVAHGEDGSPDPARVESDVSLDAARGVVLRFDGGKARFDVGARRELGATPFAPPPATRARLAASISVGVTGEAALDHLEIDLPGAATLVWPGVRCDCRVEVTKLETRRGGAVDLAIRGVVGVAPRAYDVRAAVTTFVRDVVGEPLPKKR